MPQNRSVRKTDISTGARSLLFNCAGATGSDKIYIISNPSTAHLGEAIKDEALTVSKNVEHQVVDEFEMHGQEPRKDVADKMKNATIVFCITKMSMAHTNARLTANHHKVKFFSLPDYSDEVMGSKALLADFKKIKNISVKIAELLSYANQIRLVTKAGTDLTMDIKGRRANPAPGFCFDDVLLASPPDAETNIAPNEFLTNGIAIIDGSIPCKEIGLLDSQITLEIKDGFVKKISGEKSKILTELFDRQNNPKCRLIGEFGIGLNRFAELKGSMLEDEGTLGTVHLGIGSNITIGGLNEVAFHLDHVIRNATIFVDGRIIMDEGIFSDDLLNLIH